MKSISRQRTIVIAALLSLLVIAAAFIIWLSREDGLQEGRIGFDVCVHCGMSLTEKRFSASAIFHHQTVHFDDIGCLVEYAQRSHFSAKDIKEGMVYDFNSHKMIPLKEAFFKKTTYQTPMASGIIAIDQSGDEALSLPQLLER